MMMRMRMTSSNKYCNTVTTARKIEAVARKQKKNTAAHFLDHSLLFCWLVLLLRFLQNPK